MIALLVVALPLLGAGLALTFGHRRSRLPAAATVSTTLVAWGLSVLLSARHLGSQAPGDGGSYTIHTGGIDITFALRVDQLGAVMLLLATTVAALVQIYSLAYLHGDPRYPSYTALVGIFTSAMSLVVTADDLFVLLIGWEVMGACSYFLISHHWELEPARAGAVKAFVMTRLGDIGLLFGIFVIGQAAGTYRISGVVEAALAGQISETDATVATLLMLCGVVGKSAQFPLHSWLPDAMPGPTPISALIHAATMVAAGVYLVARLLPVFEVSSVTMNVLAVIAVVTMLGSALFALAADDLKRVLAWSTVSQLSYMFAALALGGYAAGIVHLLSHGAFKALLFLAAGSVIHAVGTQRLDEMGGLRKAMPITFVTMTVGFAALAGVPPFAGFFSKDAILGLAADQAFSSQSTVRAWLVLVIGLLVAALTAAYSMRAWLMVFFGRRSASAAAQPHESPGLMVWPLVVLAAVSAVGGPAALWPEFLGVEREPVHLTMMLAGAGIVAATLLLTYGEWWRAEEGDPASALGRWRKPLRREFAYDEAVARTVVQPTFWAARLTASTESEIVETYVRGADGGAQWGGRLLRTFHSGNLQHYVTAVVLGALAAAVMVGAWR